ncbi:unnamed protein product [Nesidiocoris tenuis]|uniref:Uncharacterized protein n=1 Tax=Nesidiocoris tenuis TaxID=355587 RepID=A0A6H5G0H7_9HEMI|nr:unnamed protein product [Nesidiocoris tenuis]
MTPVIQQLPSTIIKQVCLHYENFSWIHMRLLARSACLTNIAISIPIGCSRVRARSAREPLNQISNTEIQPILTYREWKRCRNLQGIQKAQKFKIGSVELPQIAKNAKKEKSRQETFQLQFF